MNGIPVMFFSIHFILQQNSDPTPNHEQKLLQMTNEQKDFVINHSTLLVTA